MTEQAPRPPETMEPSELGFRMRRPVQWLRPLVLVQTGLQVVLSGIFGAYADKRELQGVMAANDPGDHTVPDDVWIDYVSDLGDGFDATYTVARMLAAPTLDIGVPNQRGSILVMGGDQVYPSATVAEYEDRLVGPYRAALPHTEPPHPHLFALPGNHDWYDGLTAFLRIFCQDRWVGGWKTCQTRSYWALQLPNHWWLWGIDIQFDTYIDKKQLEFFGKLDVRKGDSIILCSAKPSWVEANEGKPEAYQTLDYFERTVIQPKGAEVRLSLTGDTHHYARYERKGSGAQKITAGGGGAFLSATHHLPKTLHLPPPDSRDPKKSPTVEYERVARYPEIGRSKAFRWTAVRLLWRNPWFLLLGSAVHLLFAFVLASSLRTPDQSFHQAMDGLSWWGAVCAIPRSGVALLLVLVLLGGLTGFTKAKGKPLKRLVFGGFHTAAHVAVLAGTTALAATAADGRRGFAFVMVFALGVALLGGLGTGLVMAAYLALADTRKLNSNELFAAQGYEGLKCFLRMHLAPNGVLTVYPIGVDRVGRKWDLPEDGPPPATGPWLEPKKAPSEPRLIEGPIVIHPKGRP